MIEFSKKIFVDYSLVDKDYNLKLSSLLRFMQNAATEHYDKKGLGRARLISEGMVFLVSKIALKISCPIKAEKTLELTTWEEDIKGAYFVRDFEFRVDGEVVGQAQTLWVVVDPVTHAVLRPSDFPYPIQTPNKSVEISAGKISERTLEKVYDEKRRVRFSELDCNGHMNNCVYADYTIDVLACFEDDVSWSEAHINFNREAKLNDEMTLTLFKGDSKVVSGDSDSGKNFFKAKII